MTVHAKFQPAENATTLLFAEVDIDDVVNLLDEIEQFVDALEPEEGLASTERGRALSLIRASVALADRARDALKICRRVS